MYKKKLADKKDKKIKSWYLIVLIFGLYFLLFSWYIG